MDATLTQNTRATLAWVAAIGTLGAIDAYRSTKRDGSTLSEVIRGTVRTDTPTGRALFLLGLVVFARHIIR
jgi:hypothetical protein